jgi:hypothetical protein
VAKLTPSRGAQAITPGALGPALAAIEAPYGGTAAVRSVGAGAKLGGERIACDLVVEGCMTPKSKNA